MKIRWSYAGKTTVLSTLKPHVHFYIPRGSILSSYVMSPLSNEVNSFNSLWPGGATWQHRSGSTLAQVMACCLTAPNHNLNQCWMGWVGLWGFLWWAPSAKGKDHHGVSSGWSRVWHRSNTGLSSTQYEQIPIILGIWPFWLTPFFFRSITFWRAYG